MKCWLCDVEPEETYDLEQWGSTDRILIIRWPAATDHEHAENPPTPDELERAGHDSVMRITNP